MAVKHAKQSGLPADENDDAQVEPSDWYADHVITGIDVAFIGASATLTTQTIGTSSWTPLDFNTAEQFDTDGFHSTSVNPSRMTIPAGLGGKYLVTADVLWDADVSSANSRYTKFYTNGSTSAGEYNWRTGSHTVDTGHQRVAVLDLAAGDYVEVAVYQDRGGNLDVQGGKFQIVKLDSGKVGAGIGCKVRRTTNWTGLTTPADFTAIPFGDSDTEDFDTDGFHSTSSNNSRLTVPAGLGGKYLITGLVSFDAGVNTGARAAAIFSNTALLARGDLDVGGASAAIQDAIAVSVVEDLVPGDYIELRAYHSITGTVNVIGSATHGYTFISIMRLDSGGPRPLKYDILTYTGGDITITSSSLVEVPSGPHSVTVDAVTGDLLMVGLSVRGNAADAGNIGFDAPTMVGGSPVNYISGATSIGVAAWFIGNSMLMGAGGEVPYVVQSGDISSGSVTLTLYARSSVSRAINAATDGPLMFWVRNLGQ